MHLLACGRLAYFPQALNQHRRHHDGVTLGSSGLAQLREIREIQQWVAAKYACEPATLLIAGSYLQKLCRQFNVPVDEVLKPMVASGKD